MEIEFTSRASKDLTVIAPDHEGYSIFSGNLVTTQTPGEKDNVPVSSEERKLARDMYALLREESRVQVSINKKPKDGGYIVKLQILGWNETESLRERQYTEITRELKTQLRIMDGTPRNETVGGDYPAFGSVNFRSLVQMADAVNGYFIATNRPEIRANVAESLRANEALPTPNDPQPLSRKNPLPGQQQG